jgi:nicotinate-nucleotide adenylyltransferase
MKIGLFFGSFNPIHVGHLIIASYMVDFTDLNQVWFIVSPQNPLKNKKSLLNEYERLELIRLAIDGDNRLKVSDIEFKLPIPSYTIHTLEVLKEKHPEHEFHLIMGSDSFNTLPKWKEYEQILANYPIMVYLRPKEEIDLNIKGNIQVFEDVPQMEISASFIRNAIKNKKSVKYLLPQVVFDYIDKWGFYLNYLCVHFLSLDYLW